MANMRTLASLSNKHVTHTGNKGRCKFVFADAYINSHTVLL